MSCTEKNLVATTGTAIMISGNRSCVVQYKTFVEPTENIQNIDDQHEKMRLKTQFFRGINLLVIIMRCVE
jgi:hypothetical protein